ncbi:hypothetical protein E2562_025355 [Oryza meyeriana var. granulata]|uniref:PDZ domain-containing protein n=1 Tax=Oryza meyeriana var. granulata TaxID=110450 RepID=A0A6G1DN68_9ORYZ|nr:hypothetical protein E2562_025355 [Oryza meyeriana var. granulata]
MVGLESFTGEKHLFSFSGTIIEFLNGIGSVVTSASLIRCPDKDERADELKINVWLPSGEKLEGLVSNVDLYYNICVVIVHSTSHLPRKSFSAATEIFNLDGNHSKDVVALGRNCEPWSLKVALGRKVIRPLHGLKVGNFHKEPLALLEKIYHEFPGVCGVIVEKVEPSAEHSEIKIGDIITHLDGVPFSNAAEFGGVLLDRCATQMHRQKQNLSEDCNQMETLTSLKFSGKTRGGISGTTTKTINIDKFTPGGINRWPVPRPIVIR